MDGVGTLVLGQNFTLVLGCASDESEILALDESPHSIHRAGEGSAPLNKMFPEYSIQISTPDMFTPPEDLLSRTDHSWHGAAIMWHTSLDSNITGQQMQDLQV